MEKAIIVRYGEISIKSSWVRKEFEKQLVDNISRALISNKVSIEKISRNGARIYIWCNNISRALKVLKNVFGIVSYSPAVVIKTDIDVMKKEALKRYRKKRKKKFRITTRRHFKKFPFSSMQISSMVGEYVLENTKAKVDLKRYDININLEVNEEKTFVFSEVFRGWGGLPIGVQGKVFCVVSGKKESWVNAWYMARRGCELVFAGTDKKAKQIYKKFTKKYYFFKREPVYIDLSMKKHDAGVLIRTAGSEYAKAIVLSNNDIGKFEPKTDLLVVYPSIGHKTTDIAKFWVSMGLD